MVIQFPTATRPAVRRSRPADTSASASLAPARLHRLVDDLQVLTLTKPAALLIVQSVISFLLGPDDQEHPAAKA